jgi:hypothetical protein
MRASNSPLAERQGNVPSAEGRAVIPPCLDTRSKSPWLSRGQATGVPDGRTAELGQVLPGGSRPDDLHLLGGVRDLLTSGRHSVGFYASQGCEGEPLFDPSELSLGVRYYTRPLESPGQGLRAVRTAAAQLNLSDGGGHSASVEFTCRGDGIGGVRTAAPTPHNSHCFRVVGLARVRSDFALDSQDEGVLSVGTIVVALEQRVGETRGSYRVRCSQGWVSTKSEAGT